MSVTDDLKSDIQALAQYRQYEEAMDWMRENEKGAKAAIKTVRRGMAANLGMERYHYLEASAEAH